MQAPEQEPLFIIPSCTDWRFENNPKLSLNSQRPSWLSPHFSPVGSAGTSPSRSVAGVYCTHTPKEPQASAALLWGHWSGLANCQGWEPCIPSPPSLWGKLVASWPGLSCSPYNELNPMPGVLVGVPSLWPLFLWLRCTTGTCPYRRVPSLRLCPNNCSSVDLGFCSSWGLLISPDWGLSALNLFIAHL